LRLGDSFTDNGPRFKFSESAWPKFELNKIAERLTTVAVAFQVTVQSDKDAVVAERRLRHFNPIQASLRDADPFLIVFPWDKSHGYR